MSFFQDKLNKKKNSQTSERHFKLPKPVYYVECEKDVTVLVAMDVHVDLYQDEKSTHCYVNWIDNCPHERRMRASRYKMNNGVFMFERANGTTEGQIYRFTPMNLELYNSRVKSHTLSKLEFDKEEDMINAFLETLKGY